MLSPTLFQEWQPTGLIGFWTSWNLEAIFVWTVHTMRETGDCELGTVQGGRWQWNSEVVCVEEVRQRKQWRAAMTM